MDNPCIWLRFTLKRQVFACGDAGKPTVRNTAQSKNSSLSRMILLYNSIYERTDRDCWDKHSWLLAGLRLGRPPTVISSRNPLGRRGRPSVKRAGQFQRTGPPASHLGSRNVRLECEIPDYLGILGVAFRRKRLHQEPPQQAFYHKKSMKHAKHSST